MIMPCNNNDFPVFAAAHATLDAARVRVMTGKTRAATAADPVIAAEIHDRFLVNGIVMLTEALQSHPEPALNLQRAAWTAERVTRDNPFLTEAKQEKLVTRDVEALLRNAARNFTIPLSGADATKAFATLSDFLERKGKHNEALLLLNVAESEQLKLTGQTSALLQIRARQQRIITGQMDRIDDQLATKTIEPSRLPAPIFRF